MKRTFVLIFSLFFYSIVFCQVGINTETPTEALDVNGKVRVRDTTPLSSTTISSLYVDDTGVIGKSNASSNSSQTSFVSSVNTTDVVTNFNAGNTIQLPIASTNLGYNTLNVTVANNNVRIPSSGIYQLSGALNIQLSTGAINNRVYIAFNIQRSTDGGSTWASASGARPVFIMAEPAAISYNSVLPVVLIELNENDLLRLVIYRTSDVNGTLQGSNITTGLVSQNTQHGTKAYNLSISKL